MLILPTHVKESQHDKNTRKIYHYHAVVTHFPQHRVKGEGDRA